jgi:hypothetical protein
MLNANDVLIDAKKCIPAITSKQAELLTLYLNKRLENFLPPRISEARLREIVRDEMKKAGELC